MSQHTSSTRRLNGIEKLQARELMAADLAVTSLPGRDPTEATEVSIERVDGEVTITGTDFNDEVSVAEGLDGRISIVAKTVDMWGNVNDVRAAFPINGVTEIHFHGKDGHDFFENDTGKMSYAWGGSGNDTLIGGDVFDFLDGGTGNDTIRGMGGGDYLNGRAGNDAIYGGEGNDALVGDAGNDTLRGEDGKDFLDGGDGADRLFGDLSGGAYNDRLYGGAGGDLLVGGGGHDILHGQDGIDTLHGQGGHDRMYGGSGVDYMYGGSGQDRLDGGNDRVVDHLYGGADEDTFIHHRNFFYSTVSDEFHDYDSDLDTIEDDWHW